MSAPLACRALSIAPGERELVRDLDLVCRPGEIVALLGVNGAGKTTLLETLCGLRAPRRGQVLLNDTPLAALTRREVARTVGLLPQRVEDSFVHQVLPLVAVGRYAHRGFWQWQDARDLACAHAALAQVGLTEFAERWTESLSGGERQRLALAMLLAQAPAVMLLDEPFSQLDPFHQLHIAALLRRLRDQGQSVVMSVHDVNLAAHCADRVLLVFGDGATVLGTTRRILTEANLTRLYRTPVRQTGPADAPHFSFFS